MEKIKVQTPLYPFPIVLVGTTVEGKPNFMPAGFFSLVGLEPPMVMISLDEGHHTSKAIKKNKTFSVNIVSQSMMEKADYCGLVSGKEVDKSEVFKVEFRELRTAPLIVESPMTAECKVTRLEKEGDHVLIVGDVVGAYLDPSAAKNGKPDPLKMKTIFLTFPDNSYWVLGQRVGDAWSAGKKYMK
jgi:flavin reductase (DIM6/NTAB) family NADH-FMN oxidoreductase RutF